jgi:hypothetical protein
MKRVSSKKKGLSKRVVVILVIIAVILASISVAYHYFDLGKKLSNKFTGDAEQADSSGGKVGIVILSPEVEDKGAAK